MSCSSTLPVSGPRHLRERGLDAVTTRAVAVRAEVSHPTIFRHFGEHGFDTCLQHKRCPAARG
ncbi:helix-turn-helix domain-containing protein [Streptomyces sp. NPDC001070]